MFETDVGQCPSGGSGSARRGEARRAAVCAVALDLLGEVGYGRLTIDAVAARAGASKATIYRWWSGKAELVVDVVARSYAERREPPDTGSLRGDLTALLQRAWIDADSPRGRAYAELMSAAARSPELADELRERLTDSRAALHDAVVSRAVERGELADCAQVELLHRVMHGLILTARLWDAECPDERRAAQLVDSVLIPMLATRAAEPAARLTR